MQAERGPAGIVGSNRAGGVQKSPGRAQEHPSKVQGNEACFVESRHKGPRLVNLYEELQALAHSHFFQDHFSRPVAYGLCGGSAWRTQCTSKMHRYMCVCVCFFGRDAVEDCLN